jgi:hypothetical protein
MKTIDLREDKNVDKVEIATNSLPPAKPYNQMEFEEFLGMLGDTNTLAQATWQDMAAVLGVDTVTITRWKNHPRARAVIRDEIRNQLKVYKEHSMDDPKVTEKIMRKLGVDFGGEKLEIDQKVDVRIVDYSQYHKPKVIDGDSFTV